MLPIIRAVARDSAIAAKGVVQDKIRDRLSTINESRISNAERVKGIYTKLRDGNSKAHEAAISKNNESMFESQALTLLGSINDNSEDLLKRLDNLNEPKGGLLKGLLGGLSLLFMPFMSKMIKGFSVLASPFKLISKGLGFIGSSLLKMLAFFKIGNLVQGAGRISGAAGGIGRGAARIGGVIGLGASALAARAGGVAGARTLGRSAIKMGSKLVPGVGLALGAGFAAKRASEGDYVGALGEAASGVASTIPGLGTAAALAIQAGLVVRDMARKSNKENEQTIRSTRKSIETVNRNSTDISNQQRRSFDSYTSSLSAMTSRTKDTLIDGTDKMLSSVRDFMPKIFTNIGGGIATLMTTLGEQGPKILDTIKASVAAIVTFASSPLTAIINKIQSMLPSWMGGGDPSAADLPASTTQPTGSARQNFAKVKDNLQNAAGKFGVDAGLLAKIAYFESGKSFSTSAAPVSSNPAKNTVYNAGAGRNAMSSAHGLGQFTDATWYGTLQRHGAYMGIGSNLSKAQMNSYRRNPQVQAMALAALTRDNMARSANLSGGDRAADVYVMHNLGEGKGPKFLQQLRQNPNASVRTVLSSKEISNNPSLYGDGSITMQQAYMKMRVHLNEGQEFAGQISNGGGGEIAGIIPTTGITQPSNTKPKTTKQKATNNVKAAGGILKAISPLGILKATNKSLSAKKPVTNGSGVSGYKLKMPGTPFAPVNDDSGNNEFDFSNLGDPNYKPKKMGLFEALSTAMSPSTQGLTSNIAAKSKTKNKKKPVKLTKEQMVVRDDAHRSAGTVLIPGIGNVVKSTPAIIRSVPSAVRAIPGAVSSVYNVMTNGKPATQPKTDIKDMGGAGVRTKPVNMNGAGVRQSQSKTKSKASTTPSNDTFYSTAPMYETDMGTMGYTPPNMSVSGVGDKIAAAAESMIGTQSKSFGRCVRGVWFILGRAGIPGFPNTKSTSNDVRNWGQSGIQNARDAVGPLVQRGFQEIAVGGIPQNGDVDVLGPRIGAGANHAGHIQVFANGKWYSDHVQGRRYGTDRYTWAKSLRYGAGAAAATGELTGFNREPTIPEAVPEMSMSDKITHMMSTVFDSANVEGLREFVKGGELDKFERTSDYSSPIGEYTGKHESVLTDFGRGPNKNGTISADLKRILGGSKDRQFGDTTGIRNTTGFKGSKDRQLADTTGIRDTPGFSRNPDRQFGDTTGIGGTPGFNGNPDRQDDVTGNNSSSRNSSKKEKWWKRIFGSSTFNAILESVIPGVSGMMQSKDYTNILGTVLGVVFGEQHRSGNPNDIQLGDLESIPKVDDIVNMTKSKDYMGILGEMGKIYQYGTEIKNPSTTPDTDVVDTVEYEYIDPDTGERTVYNVPVNNNKAPGYETDGEFENLSRPISKEKESDIDTDDNSSSGDYYKYQNTDGIPSRSDNNESEVISGIGGNIDLGDLTGQESDGGGFSRIDTTSQVIRGIGGNIDLGDLSNGRQSSSIGNINVGGILEHIKNKNYGQIVTDILPSGDFLNEGLGKMTEAHFDNKLRMQNQQAQTSIVTQPNQSHTVSTGNSDGAVLPISVRNNDSIIREIAKEYLKSSM